MKGRVRSTYLRGSKVFDVDAGFGGVKGEFIARRHSGEAALEVVEMTTPWAGVITQEDESRYERAGFGRSSGLGKRPALTHN